MPKALFNLNNINRLVQESGKDISPEMSFLQDFDYTCRQMNAHTPYYYFQLITKENNPEYFDASNGGVSVICLDTLPETCDGTYYIKRTNSILHTNDQKYYVCLYSDGKPSQRYKPSSMHCLRQMYYQMIGADLDSTGQKRNDFYGICESGEDRHIRIQRTISLMRQHGVDCDFVDVAEYVRSNNLNLEILSKKEFETKLFDREHNIVFLCDGIIKYKGKYYILEIKTEAAYKWMIQDDVSDFHKYQAYTYAFEFGIDDVLFIYENRDVCSKKAFMLHVTDEDKRLVLDRIAMVDEAVEKGIVPAQENAKNNKACLYCDYKTRCRCDGGITEDKSIGGMLR